MFRVFPEVLWRMSKKCFGKIFNILFYWECFCLCVVFCVFLVFLFLSRFLYIYVYDVRLMGLVWLFGRGLILFLMTNPVKPPLIRESLCSCLNDGVNDVLLPLCHMDGCPCAFSLPGLLHDLITGGISLLCLKRMGRVKSRVPVWAWAQCFHSTVGVAASLDSSSFYKQH